jgi:hypothetical protein
MNQEFFDKMFQMNEQRKQQKSETFLKYLRQNFMNDTDENISKLYTRDKNTGPYKLCKMKSGVFSIIDRETESVIFSSYNLKEAKVEFIVFQSLTTEMGANIFNKASNL